MADADDPQGHGIGAVAGLTGIDAHTIRAWERRYAAVRPERTETGRRRYSSESVRRLQLLKAAVDCGAAIGNVAGLDDEALRKRLAELTAPSAQSSVERPRVLVASARLARQLDSSGGTPAGWDAVAVVGELDDLLEVLSAGDADAVVLHVALLGDPPEPALDRLREAAPDVLVVATYEFERRALLARVARRGAKLVRGPLRVAMLGRTLADFLMIEAASGAPRLQTPVPSQGEAPPRLFDDAQLARLLETHGLVDCECPSHLSALVTSLLAFERYTEDCVTRSPEDSAVHRTLGLGTAHARAQMERVLRHLCEHEGIRL